MNVSGMLRIPMIRQNILSFAGHFAAEVSSLTNPPVRGGAARRQIEKNIIRLQTDVLRN